MLRLVNDNRNIDDQYGCQIRCRLCRRNVSMFFLLHRWPVLAGWTAGSGAGERDRPVRDPLNLPGARPFELRSWETFLLASTTYRAVADPLSNLQTCVGIEFRRTTTNIGSFSPESYMVLSLDRWKSQNTWLGTSSRLSELEANEAAVNALAADAAVADAAPARSGRPAAAKAAAAPRGRLAAARDAWGPRFRTHFQKVS